MEKLLASRQIQHSATQRGLQLASFQKRGRDVSIAAFRNGTLCSVARWPLHLTVFAAPSYARRSDHGENASGHGCKNERRGTEACAHFGGARGLVLSGLERHPVSHAAREGISRSDILGGLFRCD